MSIFSAIGGVLGGVLSASASKKAAAAQRAHEIHMAQNQIQYKMQDAKAAGVHPLAALGHQMVLPSPTSVGTPDYSSMGQNIGRAIDATTSKEQKVDDYTRAVQSLNLDRMSMENDIIRNNLVASASRTINQAGNPPNVSGLTGSQDRGEKREDPLQSFGVNVNKNPNFSDAQQWEDRYGEAVSDYLAGPLNVPADLAWAIKNQMERYARRIHKLPAQRDHPKWRRYRYGESGGW